MFLNCHVLECDVSINTSTVSLVKLTNKFTIIDVYICLLLRNFPPKKRGFVSIRVCDDNRDSRIKITFTDAFLTDDVGEKFK